MKRKGMPFLKQKAGVAQVPKCEMLLSAIRKWEAERGTLKLYIDSFKMSFNATITFTCSFSRIFFPRIRKTDPTLS